MAEDDKTIGIGEIAGGAAVGAGIAAGSAAGYGLYYLKDGYDGHTFVHGLVNGLEDGSINIGDKIAGEVKVTQKLIDRSKKLVELAPEYEKAGFLGKQWIAFKGMSTANKIGLGVIATGAALATGWLINKWRNSGKESHVERLENERSNAKHER